jgi:hypothetical protein
VQKQLSPYLMAKSDYGVVSGIACAIFVPFSLTLLSALVNEGLREPAVSR